MSGEHNPKNRAYSLLKTIGGTAIKAGQEALKKKLHINEDENVFSGAALRLTQGLDELKGAAMKIGQILSMMDDNMLPKGWKEALAKLQSQATPRPWSEVRPILEKELGSLQGFASIEEQAVHAASIAQVHRGVLPDGRVVAIKIQYPGLAEHVQSDLAGMKRLLKVANMLPNSANYDHVFQAAELMFHQELDFDRERQFAYIYTKHFAHNPDILIPQPVEALCTPRVLTTTWVEGLNLQQWIDTHAQEPQSQQTCERLGALLLEVVLSELFNLRHIQSDPNPGNFLVTPDGKLVLLDFGATQNLTDELVENYTRLFVAGIKNNRAEVLRYGKRLGFIQTQDSDALRDCFVRIFGLSMEPFLAETYSWRDCGLSKRINTETFLYMKLTKYRAPPGDVLFINRRLGGNLLMMEKLGASFSARPILARVLPQEGLV